MKVVINACFGGYSLSPEATLECYKRGLQGIASPVDEWFGEDHYPPSHDFSKQGRLRAWRKYLKGEDTSSLFVTVFSPDEKFVLDTRPCSKEQRSDPILVAVVEEMGERADGACAKLRVVEIPDGIDWEIDEYDGNESIEETHRSWS